MARAGDDASAPESAARGSATHARRERVARWLLLAVIALLPLVYAPRIWLGARAEAPTLPTPQWIHVVMVTATRVEPGTFDHAGPRLARMLRRGSLVRSLWTPSTDARAAAASLWTGRWPRQVGALAPEPRIDDATWTLCASARAAGAATCSIGAPIDLPGFDERRAASADAAAAGAEAAAFARAHPEQRLMIWVHVDWADAAAFEALLEPLQAALEQGDRQYDTVAMLTGFMQGTRGGEIASLACPLATELPAALYAGRGADALLSHVDIAGLLAKVMQLELPIAQRGQLPLVSRALPLWGALRGTRADESALVQDRDSEQLYLSVPGQPLTKPARIRASLPLRGPEAVEVWMPGPNGLARAQGEVQAAFARKFLEIAAKAR